MTKYIISFLIIVVGLVSCNKEDETQNVEYMITGLTEQYSIVMLDGEGNSISETVNPVSPSWEYSKSYDMTRGEAVYLYVKSKEDISNSPKYFSAGIIIDGKYRYQRKGYDSNIMAPDSTYNIKMSGIVPL